MSAYINWMALTQPSKNGSFQTEGNVVANYELVASAATSGLAPDGAQYASVWCDVNSKLSVSNISIAGAITSLLSSKDFAVPASTMVQIPNITPGMSKITVTDI